MQSYALKKTCSWTCTLKSLMHCPARHPHVTQTLLLLSVSSSHCCPLASPCPVMLRWTPWCCFHKLSGHICRSLQVSPDLFGVSAVVFPLIYGMQSRKGKLTCSHFPPDCLYLGSHDDLFSIFSYESDCLGLMEEDNIAIRCVESHAVEMDAGQERHLILSLPLPALRFPLTVLTKFLRLFTFFRSNQYIAESFGLAEISEWHWSLLNAKLQVPGGMCLSPLSFWAVRFARTCED